MKYFLPDFWSLAGWKTTLVCELEAGKKKGEYRLTPKTLKNFPFPTHLEDLSLEKALLFQIPYDQEEAGCDSQQRQQQQRFCRRQHDDLLDT